MTVFFQAYMIAPVRESAADAGVDHVIEACDRVTAAHCAQRLANRADMDLIKDVYNEVILEMAAGRE